MIKIIARELKVTVAPIVFGALGNPPPKKKLEGLEIRGRIETIQVIALLRRLEY